MYGLQDLTSKILSCSYLNSSTSLFYPLAETAPLIDNIRQVSCGAVAQLLSGPLPRWGGSKGRLGGGYRLALIRIIQTVCREHSEIGREQDL